jgi:hypothetical protein
MGTFAPASLNLCREDPGRHLGSLKYLLHILVLVTSMLVNLDASALYVSAGGDLQAAINRAKPGDEILLAPGASFTGPFTLPRKPDAGGLEVVIRTATSDLELPPGQRVGPADGRKMARLVASGGAAVVRTASAAGHYRFVGLEIAPAPGVAVLNVVLLGSWTEDGRWTETRADELPHDITFDRVYIHGDPQRGSRRGIAMNGRNIAVYNSYFSDFKQECCDSQAIASWNGPGPFTIQNNYLEAAGENVMFGGGDPSIPGLVPSDIQLRDNHFFKPLRWKSDDPAHEGVNWVVKNLLELKNARNVVIDGNVFENNWADDQNGFAILFTPRNQDGGSPWSTVEHVEFTNNVVRHSTSGINILGWDNLGPSQQASNLVIRNNVFWDIGGARWGEDAASTYGYGKGGWFLQLMDGTSAVIVEHNIILASKGILVADIARPVGTRGSTLHTGFVFRNNIVRYGSMGIAGASTPPGYPTLNQYFYAPVIERNVVIGGQPAMYPPDNFTVASIDDVGFEDWTHCNFRLSADSLFTARATDGADIGVTVDSSFPPDCGRDGGSIDSPWLFGSRPND